MAKAQERIRAEVPIPAGSWLEWGGQFENLISAAQRLMSFGLDSGIEVSAPSILLWRFTMPGQTPAATSRSGQA